MFVSGNEKLDILSTAFEQKHNTVDDIIKRSEKMLSSATVAGLATNFAKMKKKLTFELWCARFSFYVGIAFLTISASPLLAFAIMPIAAPILHWMFPGLTFVVSDFTLNPADNGWQYLGQVLARILILLPAAWLVSFTAIRHASLFRLREHYAYKYSMAVAVEGFKQQSPKYEQEIAALVLEQLAFNPADKLIPSKDVREGKTPSISGYLLDQIRNKIENTLPLKAK